MKKSGIILIFAFSFVRCDNGDDTPVAQYKGNFTMGVWIGGNVTPQVSISFPEWKSNLEIRGFVAGDSCEFFRPTGSPCSNVEAIDKISLTKPLIGFELKGTAPNLFAPYIAAGLQLPDGTYQSASQKTLSAESSLSTTLAMQKAICFPDPENPDSDAIWLIGGLSGRLDHNISYSNDGLTWITPETPSANFTNRIGHQVVTMIDPETNKNAIWIIGGKDLYSSLNDIWKSPDGITWSQVAPTSNVFGPRWGHSVAVMPDPNNNNKPTLWLVGGYNGTTLLVDVWKSTDGNSWTNVTTIGDEIVSAFYSPLLVMNDQSGKPAMWLIGGNQTDTILKSNDGVTWTTLAAGSRFSPRLAHAGVVMKDPSSGVNALWAIGGYSDYALKDVWMSTDGLTWKQVKDDSGVSITPRLFHSAATMKDKSNDDLETMWIIGGTTNGDDLSTETDCWKSVDGKSFRKGIKFSFSF